MSILKDKKALIIGVANEKSIAWGIAVKFHEEGAKLAFSYASEQLERRVKSLAESVGCSDVFCCDVSKDEDIDNLFSKVENVFGKLDILVHAVAYAPKNEFEYEFYKTTREGFLAGMNVSVYSLIATARKTLPLMRGRNGSILTLTYYGAEKVIPFYNVMGVTKSALESTVRYLAYDFGKFNIRVNAISSGPIRTLSTFAFKNFNFLQDFVESNAPLRRLVDSSDIAGTASFLCSDLAKGITGEIIHVDAGYNIIGLPAEKVE